jgi:hypothetical protein
MALDLPELVTSSWIDYVNMAVKLVSILTHSPASLAMTSESINICVLTINNGRAPHPASIPKYVIHYHVIDGRIQHLIHNCLHSILNVVLKRFIESILVLTSSTNCVYHTDALLAILIVGEPPADIYIDELLESDADNKQ